MSLGNFTTRIDSRFLREVAPQAPLGMRILLYDFGTGEYEIMSRHAEALLRYVIPMLGEDAAPCSVWIRGLASRRGDSHLNMGLSFARSRSVEGFILDRCPHVARLVSRHALSCQHFGEEHSVGQTENSGYHRSVLIVLSPRMPSRPPPPDPSFVAPVFNRFRVLLQRGIDASGGVVAAASYVFIIDYDTNAPGSPPSDPVVYRLFTGGVAYGAPVGVSIGDPNTDWNLFRSMHVTTTRGFEGQALWVSSSISVGVSVPGSTASFRMMPEASAPHRIDVDPFKVSRGLGLGMIALRGPFWIDHNGTYP